MCEIKLTDLKEGDYVYRVISDWGHRTVTKHPIEKITSTGNIRLGLGYYDSQGYAKGKSSGCIEPLTAKAYRDILKADLIKDISTLFTSDKEKSKELVESELFDSFLKILKILGKDNFVISSILMIAETLDSIKDLDDNYIFTREDFK